MTNEKESAKNASDSMVFVTSDIKALHSSLCRSNPLGAVAVLTILQQAADLQNAINNIYLLLGDNND